jgi:hypothetical protein
MLTSFAQSTELLSDSTACRKAAKNGLASSGFFGQNARMIRGTLRFFLFIISLSLLSSTAFSCTCIDYGVPACKLFGNADAVFVGKIERIVSTDDDKNAQVTLSGVNSISSRGVGLVSVEFSIEKAFKGVAGRSTKALTYTGTSCDLGVKEGQRWVIFAVKDPHSGLLGFGACGGSGQLGDNDTRTEELGQVSDGGGMPIVRGRVTRDRYEVVKDAKVSLIGDEVRLDTHTDETGSFIFRAPKPGKYTVTLSVPFSAGIMFASGYIPSGFKESVLTETESKYSYDVLAKQGACEYQYFDAYWIDLKATASISGKFIRTDRNFSREFYPKICHLKPTEAETLQSCELSVEVLKPDGSFSFQELREGRYVIEVGDDFPSGPEPFVRHYFPGVQEFSKAKVIEIRQGEEKQKLLFDLPSMLPTRTVHGQIVTSDGQPAILQDADARFFYLAAYYYKNGKEPDLFLRHSYIDEWAMEDKGHEVEMVRSKPDGSFELDLFNGYTYIIKVESGQVFNGHQCGLGVISVTPYIKEPVKIILDRDRPCDVAKFANEVKTALNN